MDSWSSLGKLNLFSKVDKWAYENKNHSAFSLYFTELDTPNSGNLNTYHFQVTLTVILFKPPQLRKADEVD